MKRLAVCLALILVGCITTTTPDGATTRTVDLQATIALTELALASAEQAYDLWLQQQEQRDERAQLDYQREAAIRQERIELLRGTLMGLYRRRVAE